MSNSPLTVASVFSGIGGFPLGFRNNGFKISLLCEKDKSAKLSLAKNFKNVPQFTDVRDVKGSDLLDSDVLLAAFPCTDISIANGNNFRNGIYGKESGLWFETLRIISEKRPAYAVMENVPALRARGLEEVLLGLSEIGYDATWTTLDAQYFGVPQRRRRIFILAVRDGIPAGADIFGHNQRSGELCSRKVQDLEAKRRRNFEESGNGGKATSYYTLQSFTEYKSLGVSSTLLKRDYKYPVDIVVNKGIPRRVTPLERLRLNGYPDDWLDGLGLTDTTKYKLSGMNVPCVEYVARCLLNFHNR